MPKHINEHHHHGEGSELSEMDLRVRALESLLIEKGYVDPEALDTLIDTYENKIGPRNGAIVVAKAWCEPDFKKWLLQDGSAAIHSLGFTGRQGEHMIVVENTPKTHNIIVCTLCSCYPWPVLGLPPTWYKSPQYRSRVMIDPRGVLKDFGVELPKNTNIAVHDSTAETRYLVLTMRPEGTDSWNEEQLAELVSRNSMIGTDILLNPTGR